MGKSSQYKYRGSKLSDPCPTIDSLIALGFERREPKYGAETAAYRFPNLELEAIHVMNLYARYVVLLSGFLNTGRTMATIEDQIPTDLESALEAAAWVSYALRSHKSDLGPLPDWFVEGERHWDLVAPAREERAARERQRAYEASPKCYVDRDYARPLRHNLREQISWLREDAEMIFSFDGRVLSVDFFDHVHEVVASGDRWPSSYRVLVSPMTEFPARFTSSSVVVSVFEGYVRLDGHRLGPCQAIT